MASWQGSEFANSSLETCLTRGLLHYKALCFSIDSLYFFVVANHLDSCRIIQSFPNNSSVFFSTPRCLVTKISLKAFKGTKFLAFSGLSPSCCSLLPWSSQANRGNPVVNLDNDMWQCNVKMTIHDLWKESLHLFSIVGFRLMYKTCRTLMGKKREVFLNLFLLRRQGSFLLKPCRGLHELKQRTPNRIRFKHQLTSTEFIDRNERRHLSMLINLTSILCTTSKTAQATKNTKVKLSKHNESQPTWTRFIPQIFTNRLWKFMAWETLFGPGSTPKENPIFLPTQKPTPVQNWTWTTPALTRCHWANAKPWAGSAVKNHTPAWMNYL